MDEEDKQYKEKMKNNENEFSETYKITTKTYASQTPAPISLTLGIYLIDFDRQTH